MKHSLLLLIVMLILACIDYPTARAQNKNFELKTAEVRIYEKNFLPYPPFFIGYLKRETVSFYHGKPFDLPGMVYINPGDSVWAHIPPEQKKKKEKKTPVKNESTTTGWNYNNSGVSDTALSCDADFRIQTSAWRNYIDTAHWDIGADYDNLSPAVTVNPVLARRYSESRLLAPFYFKKTEVTNAEYREFVDWVKDSLAHELLSEVDKSYMITDEEGLVRRVNRKKKIDWSFKTHSPEEIEALSPLFINESERFYRKREIDTRKLLFLFIDFRRMIRHLEIYPDTSVWVSDFTYSYNEDIAKKYFNDPKYDNYPVTGVSYLQAQAFCVWKTDQLNAYLKKKGIKQEVVVDLPDAFDREAASQEFDESWICDLMLVPENNTLYLRKSLFSGERYAGIFDPDGYFYTHPADLETLKKHKCSKTTDCAGCRLLRNLDSRGISGLGDNVSEWTKDIYAYNWKPVYEKRRQIIESFQKNRIDTALLFSSDNFAAYYQTLKEDCGFPPFENDRNFIFSHSDSLKHGQSDSAQFKISDDLVFGNREDILNRRQERFRIYAREIKELFQNEIPIIRNLEDYHDQKNDKDGQLVCGGNWFDERFSEKNGRNYNGIHAKKFVSPDKKSSTIGFRYVVRFVVE